MKTTGHQTCCNYLSNVRNHCNYFFEVNVMITISNIFIDYNYNYTCIIKLNPVHY